ncbi:MAG: efflux RND transporter periplasmic adaptor subunit [Candidatus Nitrospinota bacterium M3_3B_026]
MKRAFLHAAFALLFAACSAGAGDGVEEKAAPGAGDARLVNVMAVKPRTFRKEMTLMGTVRADREVVIAPEAPGRVVRIGFEKGGGVEAGQPLVWLDAAEIEARIAQAEAERDLAALDHDKLKALAGRRANVSEYQLEQARLGLKAAEARLSGLRVARGNMTVRAPFAGMIAARDVEKGAIVSPGQPLGRLIAIDPVKIETGAPETSIADFSIGKDATVRFDAFPEEAHTGKVSYIAPEINPMTRVFDMEVELGNKAMRILPEMSARVTFVRKEIAGAVLIPQDVILELPEGHAVFVVEEGVARKRMVTIDDMAGEEALIGSGAAPGDILVTAGGRGLTDGDRVRIMSRAE